MAQAQLQTPSLVPSKTIFYTSVEIFIRNNSVTSLFLQNIYLYCNRLVITETIFNVNQNIQKLID